MAITLNGSGSIDGYTGLVFNEVGADSNIRIETSTNPNAFWLDGGTGFLGLGTNSPQRVLHVNVGELDVAARFESTDELAQIEFYDNTSTNVNSIGAIGNDLLFKTNNAERIRIASSGNVGIGTSSPTELLHIEPSSGNADLLIRRYATGDDARIFIKRKDNTGRAYISYTNEDTIDTWYTGLLRNNNNNLVLGSRSDDYSINSIHITNDHSSLSIGPHGSSNPDTTDTSTHQKIEIRANGTGDSGNRGNYKRDCFVQNTTGNTQYHWYKVRLGGGSYGSGTNVKYTATWSTAHASGQGFVDGSFIVRANHASRTCQVYGHTVYSRQSVGGTYYGWTESPDITLFGCDAIDSQAGLYFRVEGYRSSGYDGGLVHSLYLEIFGQAYNTSHQGIAYVGTSTPSDVGASISRTILS